MYCHFDTGMIARPPPAVRASTRDRPLNVPVCLDKHVGPVMEGARETKQPRAKEDERERERQGDEVSTCGLFRGFFT